MLLSKSNKLFNKLMSHSRKNHIINLLESFDTEHLQFGRNIPLDMFIRKYYLQHKEVNNIDRDFINDNVYNLIRYKGLLDVLAKGKTNWYNRFEAFYNEDFESQRDNLNLPPHIRVSFPKVLFDLISASFGVDKAMDYCRVMNERAPLTIRTNLLKTNREDLYRSLRSKGLDISKTEHSPYGITFNSHLRSNFFNMDEFKWGQFEVQDEGSQLVSLRVNCRPGDIILDYCGGSAGKTLAIAPFTQGKGQIYVHDVRKNILLEAKRRLRRAGVQNYQLNNDKASIKNLLKNKCDWVMLDVPCSGSGTIRRNPDLKWKFSLEKLEETLAVQESILLESLDLVKPNGRIVYITCSLLQEENLNQIYKFCKKYGLKIENNSVFQTLPKSKKMDSFFSVTLIK